MEIDKRVEGIESELKLMRGEVKNTLGGVRDYLQNLKLPASADATLLAAAIRGGGSEMTMDGKFTFDKDAAKNMTDDKDKDKEDEAEEAEDKDAEDEAEDADGAEPTEPEMAQEGEIMGKDNGGPMLVQAVPPVNLLANLMRWVACAKREIGPDQLTTFLEVYGISGHLSQELKDIILHLSEITQTSGEPVDAVMADKWSQLMLELHGILSGTGALRPGGMWGSVPKPKEKPKDKPTRLKLVLAGDDGKDKEFSLDLKPNDSK